MYEIMCNAGERGRRRKICNESVCLRCRFLSPVKRLEAQEAERLTLCLTGANKQQQQGEDEEGEEDDLYTQLGEKDGSNPDQNSDEALVIANRPPAPTPRPECMNAKPCKTPYIVQGTNVFLYFYNLQGF